MAISSAALAQQVSAGCRLADRAGGGSVRRCSQPSRWPDGNIFTQPLRRALKPAGQPLSALVAAQGAGPALDEESKCLATAVYFESMGEPLEGQLAVAQVVINRAQSGRYPASWCGVVKQKAQFSFVRAGRFPRIDAGCEAWRKAQAIARIAAAKLACRPCRPTCCGITPIMSRRAGASRLDPGRKDRRSHLLSRLSSIAPPQLSLVLALTLFKGDSQRARTLAQHPIPKR